MFLWIAVASALIGAAVVVSIFFGKQLLYNEKVLSEQQKTVTTLKANNNAVTGLEDEIRILDTNQDLASVKANDDDQTLQVVLDALPSDANSLALGASLQNKLLAGIDGLDAIQTLQVTPVVGVESQEATTMVDAGTDETIGNAIDFSFQVTGTQSALKKALENLEHSIRTIEVTSVTIENQAGGKLAMTVRARAFYEPAVNLELKDKAVPR